ncbi:hypothetical protein SDC9_173756 [bioreactor metagenome]|uniref:Uncharacterized protein n=1 Tax=bioreactor metagenome TaxID=1076179 RepID=A0A645GKE2_9ZZZZ
MFISFALASIPSRIVCQNWLENTFKITAYSASPSAGPTVATGVEVEATLLATADDEALPPQATMLRLSARVSRAAMRTFPFFMSFFLLIFLFVRYRCLKSGNREIDFPFRLNYTFSPIKCQQPAGNFIGLMGKRLLKLCKPTNKIGIYFQKQKK